MMDGFPPVRVSEAPPEVRGVLRSMQQKYGFELNLFAGLANSTTALRGYVGLSEIFVRSSFSQLQQQVLQLTVAHRYGSACCTAMHASRAKAQALPPEELEHLLAAKPLSDSKLQALRLYALSLIDNRDTTDKQALEAFLAAGFTPPQALEVALGVALAGFASQADQLMQLAVDDRYHDELPASGAEE